jgi:hypothetical protein
VKGRKNGIKPVSKTNDEIEDDAAELTEFIEGQSYSITEASSGSTNLTVFGRRDLLKHSRMRLSKMTTISAKNMPYPSR